MTKKWLQCDKCKTDVSFSDSICPQCGAKNPAVPKKPYMFGVLAILVLVGLIGSKFSSKKDSSPDKNSEAKTDTNAKEKKWYENGTLHKGTAIDWQNATYRNKLATCADFIANWQIKKSFNSKIAKRLTTLKDIKILARTLVLWIDQAYKPIKDKEQNDKIFANQPIIDAAVMAGISLKWFK